MSEVLTTQPNESSSANAAWCVYSPDVDIYENEAELLLVAEVPGAVADRISIDLLDSVLSVTAELPRSNGYRTSYRRQFKLNVPVDPDKVTAELKAGELTIRLGKADSHRPRRIDVKAS